MEKTLVTLNEVEPIFISVHLDNKHAQANIEDTLNSYVSNQLLEHINPVSDAEPRRYKPSYVTDLNVVCNFNKDKIFKPTYLNAKFVNTELNKQSLTLRKCVYLFEYFSTDNNSSQNLICRQISRATDDITLGKDNNGYIIPILNINKSLNDEFNTILIPKSYPENLLYLKIRFFNSKTGKITTFQTIPNDDTEESSYLLIHLDKTNNTYSFHNNASHIAVYETTMYATSTSDSSIFGANSGIDIQISRNNFNPLINDSDIIV